MRFSTRLILIFILFAGFSSWMNFLGKTESPALDLLRKATVSGVDIAIIGDSRAHVGFSPQQIVKSLSDAGISGIRSVNFGVDGTDVLHHYSLAVNQILANKQAPSIIVWATNPLQYNNSRSSNRLEQLEFSDAFPLLKSGASIEMFLDLFSMKVFSPWKHKPILAHILSDYSERAGLRTIPFQTKILGLTFEKEKLSRRYFSLPDGQEPFEVLDWKDRFQRGAKAYLQDYQNLELSELHFSMAQRLASAVHAAGSRLVIVEMPVSPWFLANLAVNKKHIEWRKRMQSIASEENALFWNHADFIKGGDELFGDPGHMPVSTASSYSYKFGKLLFSDLTIRAALEAKIRVMESSL